MQLIGTVKQAQNLASKWLSSLFKQWFSHSFVLATILFLSQLRERKVFSAGNTVLDKHRLKGEVNTSVQLDESLVSSFEERAFFKLKTAKSSSLFCWLLHNNTWLLFDLMKLKASAGCNLFS